MRGEEVNMTVTGFGEPQDYSDTLIDWVGCG